MAELGAAYLCARLNVTLAVRDDHAQYLQSWPKVLRGDKKAIFTAAARAQEAVEFVL